MNKHTPGPWIVIEDPKYPRLAFIKLSNGEEFEATAALSETEKIANLVLAAAAPEILSTCRAIRDSISESKHADRYSLELSKLDYIIAKAEGK